MTDDKKSKKAEYGEEKLNIGRRLEKTVPEIPGERKEFTTEGNGQCTCPPCRGKKK